MSYGTCFWKPLASLIKVLPSDTIQGKNMDYFKTCLNKSLENIVLELHVYLHVYLFKAGVFL